jgi:hypothetical protein
MTQTETEIEVYHAAVRIYAALLVADKTPGMGPNMASCVVDALEILERVKMALAPGGAGGGKK